MEAAGEDRRIGRALGVRDAGNDVRDDASTHTLTQTAIEVASTTVWDLVVDPRRHFTQL